MSRENRKATVVDPAHATMELIVTNRADIERGIVVRSSYVVVSIHDSHRPPARIPRLIGIRGVLAVGFDDAEPTPGLDLPDNVILMTPEHARAIWEFVQNHRDQVGAIVCHCEQGMSRSPAIAAALCVLLGEDPAEFLTQYQPNQYVRRVMLDAVQGHA